MNINYLYHLFIKDEVIEINFTKLYDIITLSECNFYSNTIFYDINSIFEKSYNHIRYTHLM